MKAIYARYNDTYYKMYERATNKYPNIVVDDESVFVKKREQEGEAFIELNLGLINSNINTNKEEYDKMVSYIKEKGLKKIEKLEPFFEVYVDFTLLDAVTDEVIDDGVIRRYLKKSGQNFFRVLGIDAENEMYTRLVKRVYSDFYLNYRESVPCGIMGKPKRKFAFKIHSISIHQLFHDEEFIKNLNDRLDCYHKSSEGVAITREAYSKEYNRPKDVVVFDSKVEGMEFKPIELDGTFRKLILTIDAVLNNYIVVMNDNIIEDMLEEEEVFDDIDDKILYGGDGEDK